MVSPCVYFGVHSNLHSQLRFSGVTVLADTTHVDGSLPTSRAPELVAELHRLIGELQNVDLSACSDTE
ncbi:hypothetical protein GTC6_20850, partial [Gordonia terrae C-6]